MPQTPQLGFILAPLKFTQLPKQSLQNPKMTILSPCLNKPFSSSLLSFILVLPPLQHHLLPLLTLSPAPAILNCLSYAIFHVLFPLPGKPSLLHTPSELTLLIL